MELQIAGYIAAFLAGLAAGIPLGILILCWIARENEAALRRDGGLR